MTNFNADSSGIAQIEQSRETPVIPYQAGLSDIDIIKYGKIISHLDRSTDSGSIETA